MPNSRFYSSTAAATTLQVTANPADSSIQVTSSSGWPGSFPFIISLDYGAANEELCLVTGGGPSTFAVTRAYDGTSASTHNAGAVVRHVSSAIDFTDSRTHEASSTGVHGITGSFVDTNSTQTLNNKTLNAPSLNNPTITGTAHLTGATIDNGTYTTSTMTSPVLNTPTVNNPTVTGTVAGTPTFSGTPAFNAGVSISGGAETITRTSSTSAAVNLQVTGDSVPRLAQRADGRLAWGSGSGVADTSLSRSSAGVLSLSGSFTSDNSITATGNVAGNEIVTTGTTWIPFTPTWTVGGSPAFNTNVGWYWKLGKIVFFEIYTVWSAAGTGTSAILANLPSTPFRDGNGANTTRQIVEGHGTAFNILSPTTLVGVIAAGGTGTSFGVNDTGNNPVQSNYIQNGSIITIKDWYREA